MNHKDIPGDMNGFEFNALEGRPLQEFHSMHWASEYVYEKDTNEYTDASHFLSLKSEAISTVSFMQRPS
jgi:hypothetical protein